jgi:hypothetical protein
MNADIENNTIEFETLVYDKNLGPYSETWKRKMTAIVSSMSNNFYASLIEFWRICLESLSCSFEDSKKFMRRYKKSQPLNKFNPASGILSELNYLDLQHYGAILYIFIKPDLDDFYFKICSELANILEKATEDCVLLTRQEASILIPRKDEIRALVSSMKLLRKPKYVERGGFSFLSFLGLIFCASFLLGANADYLEYCYSPTLNFSGCPIVNGYTFRNCAHNSSKIINPVITCQELKGGETNYWNCYNKFTLLSELYCQQNCLTFPNLTLKSGCDGDSNYSQQNVKDLNSPCYCEYTNKTEICLLQDGSWSMIVGNVSCGYIKYKTTSYGQIISSYIPGKGKNDKKPQEESQENLKRQLNSQTVFVELESRTLIIKQIISQEIYVFISKEDFNTVRICNDIRCEFPLPSSVWIHSGEILIHVTNNQSQIYSKSIEIVAVRSCDLHDCVRCMHTMYLGYCMPPTLQIFSLTMIILAVVIILCSLDKLIALIWIIILTLMIPFKICSGSYDRAKESKAWNKVKNYYTRSMKKEEMKEKEKNKDKYKEKDLEVAESEKEVYMTDSGDWAIKTVSGSRKPWRNADLNLGIIVFVSLLTVVSSCSSGLFVPFENAICTRTTQMSQTCTGTFNLLGTLSTIGDSICFSANSSEGVLFEGEIKYLEMINVVELETLYYTSDWTGATWSSSKCASESNCAVNTVGGCPSTSQGDKSIGGNIVSPQVLNYPGQIGCDNGDGCAGSGCFFCTPSCVYWGWSMVPQGTVLTVARPFASKLVPKLSLRINSDTIFVSVNGLSGINGNFKITNEGSLVGDQTIFGLNNIIYDDTIARIGATSAKNAPIRMNVGDIQATSPTALSTASPTAFIYDINNVQHTTSGRTTTFVIASSGYALTWPVLDTLPKMIAGNIWAFANNSLQSALQNPGQLLFSLETTNSVTFVQNVNLVCPLCGTEIEASGCYSCTEGFRLNVSLGSSCLEGPVQFSTNSAINLFTSSITLTQSAMKSYALFGSTTSAQNNFELIVKANGGECEIPVIFTAIQNINLRNTTEETRSESNVGTVLSDLLSFSSSQPIWGSILIYVLFGLALAAIIFLLPICFMKSKSFTVNLLSKIKSRSVKPKES